MGGKTIPTLPDNMVDQLYRRGTVPLAAYLAPWAWVTPNRISFAGFLVGGMGAAVCILTLPLWVAGVAFAVGDLLDYLDGDVARQQGSGSIEGAIFDSVLDRYTDFLVIGALIYLTAVMLDRQTDFLIGTWINMSTGTVVLLGLAALLGATITPFVRAKTEAEGKISVLSIGDRAMRNRILIVGLLLGQPVWIFGVIGVVSNFAAFHRLFVALRKD